MNRGPVQSAAGQRIKMLYLLHLIITAATVAMEAAGEHYQGKLGVAWVIQNRARKRSKSVIDICLQAKQFSCWNTESVTRMNLDLLSEKVFAECIKAAMGVLNGIEEDPTQDADHYLNPEVTKAGRPNGDLPEWAADPTDKTKVDPQKMTVRIGRHVFLRLE